MPKLFDTHTHVNFKAYKADAEAVIERALGEGTWLTNVGSQLTTSRRAVEFAERYSEGVYAAIGLHPVHVVPTEVKEELAGEHVAFVTHGEEFDAAAYRELAASPKVVAVGEIGLDYYRPQNSESKEAVAPESDYDAWSVVQAKQREVFAAQLDLADELKKPVIIHCRPEPKFSTKEGRDAHDDILNILEKRYAAGRPDAGIVHFFTGTLEQAERYWSLGFYIAFGGVITFAKEYHPLVKAIPLERLVIETDAPYVTPVPHRGTRNEPSYVKFVARKIAKLKDVPLESVAKQTTQNALKVFNLADILRL